MAIDPLTASFMGVSAGFQILGAYLGGKQQQAEYKRQAQELKIRAEVAFINSLANENNISQAALDTQTSNMATSSGGESFEALQDENNRLARKDIRRNTTQTIMEQDAYKRERQRAYQMGRQARTASLIKIAGTGAQYGYDWKSGAFDK